jgi:hypothetical protein
LSFRNAKNHEFDVGLALVVATVQGTVVYDGLTRSAGYLVKSDDAALAKDYIARMQAWAQEMFREPFDPLITCMSDLSEK